MVIQGASGPPDNGGRVSSPRPGDNRPHDHHPHLLPPLRRRGAGPRRSGTAADALPGHGHLPVPLPPLRAAPGAPGEPPGGQHPAGHRGGLRGSRTRTPRSASGRSAEFMAGLDRENWQEHLLVLRRRAWLETTGGRKAARSVLRAAGAFLPWPGEPLPRSAAPGGRVTAADFLAGLPFAPDRFQAEAAAAIDRGETVVVCAPTGSGKTVVAEAAVARAARAGRAGPVHHPAQGPVQPEVRRLPPRASGRTAVGLLTGDNSINGRRPVVVMTTEVLRNMMYAASPDLADVGRGGAGRGPLPAGPGARAGVGGDHHPPGPGDAAGLPVGHRGQRRGVRRLDRGPARPDHPGGGAGAPGAPGVAVPAARSLGGRPPAPAAGVRGRGAAPAQRPPDRDAPGARRRPSPLRRPPPDRGLRVPAPARASSRRSTSSSRERGATPPPAAMVDHGLRLTTAEEAAAIRAAAAEHTAHLDPGRPGRPGLRALAGRPGGRGGAAPRRPGPGLQGGRRAALRRRPGQAGVRHRDALAGDQHAGPLRGAGEPDQVRRERGTSCSRRATTPSSPGAPAAGASTGGARPWCCTRPTCPFERVAAIAATGSHPLRSSFRPTYNMAANLVATYPRPRAEQLLNASFAQFHDERGEADLAERDRARRSSALAADRAAAECERGDVWALAAEPPRARDEAMSRLRRLDRGRGRPGVARPSGARSAGWWSPGGTASAPAC